MAQPLSDSPLLQGPMAPWPMEGDVDDLFVTQGEIPRDLNGALYRIGPNVKRRSVRGNYGFHHGDGMVHALYLRDGKAAYKNRWVRTPKLELEDAHGRALFEWEDDFPDWRALGWARVVRNELTEGVPAGVANTNVIPFASRLLALGEDAVAPLMMDPKTLATLGPVAFASRLGPGVTPKVSEDDGFLCAHPKWDPARRELVGWGFSTIEPYVIAQFVSGDGRELRSVALDAPYPPFLHDGWITEDFLVLPICPITFRHERVAEGRCIMGWEPERGVHFAVVPRRNGGPVRWFRTEACYVLHTQSAIQEGNHILCDGPLFPHPPFPADGLELDWTRVPAGKLVRWTLDLERGSISQTVLDDRPIEFPRIDDRFAAKRYRWGFNAGSSHPAGELYKGFDSVLRYDMANGARAVMHTIPGNVLVSEPVFAPRGPDAREGEGYLFVPVIRLDENRSDFVILDAEHLDGEPVATIALPHRIPPTPHGSWLAM